MSRASSTAAEPTETARSAMPVSVRTRLATENDLWKQRCSTRPDAPDRRRQRVLLLQLAEDLRLADHHRVEARGDAEQMAHRVAVAVRCRAASAQVVGSPRSCVSARNAGSAPAIASGVAPAGHDLDAVAGREDDALLDTRPAHQVAQRGLEASVRERHPLAHLDRRRAVAQPDEDDPCSTLRTLRRGRRGRAR